MSQPLVLTPEVDDALWLRSLWSLFDLQPTTVQAVKTARLKVRVVVAILIAILRCLQLGQCKSAARQPMEPILGEIRT